MFVFGFIFGLVVAAGVVWLLVRASSTLDDSGLSVLLARRRIHDIERAAINRMLAEAEAARRQDAAASEVIELDDRRT